MSARSRRLRDIEVSPIGMGCMGLSHGYGDVPDEDYSVDAVRAAYDFGCTFFDTAEAYSPNLQGLGHNERILGKALEDHRGDVVIATKVHLPADEAREKGVYRTLRDHLDASLERLRTDYADLYYLHRVNTQVPVSDVARAMGQLMDEGMIRGWGLSQVPVDIIREAHEITPLSAVQNIYSMVERGVEEDVMPYLLRENIAMVPFSPIASGFLSGRVNADTDFSHSDDVRKFVPQLKADNIRANQPVLDLLGEYARAKDATMAQISLAWMLHKYPNVVPIPGSKNKERILENLGAWNVELTDEEFRELEAALDAIPVKGHRGYVEFEGSSMSSWDREEE